MEKMLKFFKRIERWFNLNIGWFFVNGRNREAWENYLTKKYRNEQGNNSNSL